MIRAARRPALRALWRSARRAALAGLVALPLAATAQAEIVSARYVLPTTRYAHGVLGDAIEYGGLEMRLRDGRRLRLTLPETSVFEDLAPRLADLDGDGAPELVTVESSATLGARLAIYDETGLVAATPHIGRRNRWLAPLGAADLDGDGRIELAYIDRPHLAKTLRIWRYEKAGKQVRVTEIAVQPGLTNHRIGEDFISGGIRDCGQGPEIVTANGDWSRVVISRLADGRITSRDAGRYENKASLDAALGCRAAPE
ncbi:FG-GAP repeat domain-containing protein [Shimia sp.]|uniref:FG-GAP repeat domain-containing protein n=1 Tax=Shimia sp. TaxID=1954381 RepID=UPI00356B3200